jgi:hypothetical protein
VGKWPASQVINRISNIAVYDNGSNIVGIQISYVIDGQTSPVPVLHGSNNGNVNNVTLTSMFRYIPQSLSIKRVDNNFFQTLMF